MIRWWWLAVVLGLVVGAGPLAAEQASDLLADRDADGLDDSFEDWLASAFLPPIFFHRQPGEECGPIWPDFSWRIDGRVGSHLPGILGYDVVELGFDGLYAIEYTIRIVVTPQSGMIHQ